MKILITASSRLSDEQMEEAMKLHFEELNNKISQFMRRRTGVLDIQDESSMINIEHHSMDYMLNNYVRYFNENVRDYGDGFATDWDDDDTMYILYKDGTVRTISVNDDDGTRRIKKDGIDSIIISGSWGDAYAGRHVEIYNLRETTGYGRYGYKSVEQRFNDWDDIRLDFTV